MTDSVLLTVLVVVGVVAGVINTVAGGGSLLTLPALMFVGLPASVANGTNRVGVLLGAGSAVAQFRRSGRDVQVPWVELVPAVVGALVGSALSVDVDEETFRKVVGVAMLAMLVALLLKPSAWLEGRAHAAPGWVRAIGFAVIGLYGGFLQAGVGVFLLAGSVLLSGTDLVDANVRKVALVGIFTVPALLVFLVEGQVRWAEGLALALGTILGSAMGARWTVAWGPAVVRWLLIVVVVVSSTRLLGLW